jgi:hypothetical protein
MLLCYLLLVLNITYNLVLSVTSLIASLLFLINIIARVLSNVTY